MASDKDTGKKRAGIFFCLLLTALFGAATLALAWKIVDYLSNEYKSRDYWDKLQSSVTIMEERKPEVESRSILDAEAPLGEEPEAEEPEIQIPETIDFDSLHAISGDAVAWLFSPGTKINYPVAQAEDNVYYLHRRLDGTTASGGTLFADYRCAAGFSDWNTVIYGHHMKSGAMFGRLSDYRDPAYYAEHPAMYLYVPEKRYKLELIAAYTTDVYDEIFSVPASKERRDEILARARRKSSFVSDAAVGEEDKLVTLSTCSYAYGNARYVVIGRIVED